MEPYVNPVFMWVKLNQMASGVIFQPQLAFIATRKREGCFPGLTMDCFMPSLERYIYVLPLGLYKQLKSAQLKRKVSALLTSLISEHKVCLPQGQPSYPPRPPPHFWKSCFSLSQTHPLLHWPWL